MCSLCGVLGCDDHWTNAVDRPGIYTRNTDRISRRREAARRLVVANAVLATRRLRLAEWQGRFYVLASPTGRTRVFDAFSHLWSEAVTLTGRPFDPLDPEFIASVEAIG